MKTRLFGLVGAALAAAAFAACKEDPTESLAGSPDSVLVSLSPIFVNEAGATKSVVASVVDHSLSPLQTPVTASSAASSVASVVPDSSKPDPTRTHATFTVTGLAPGATTLTFAGAGLTTTVPVAVMPLAFRGAASSTTPKGGDTLTLHATTVLKFDPATANILFGGDTAGIVLAASAESLRVWVPYGSNGLRTDTVVGIVVTYIPGLKVKLPVAPNIVVTGDFWAGDSSWQTAPDLTPLLPASGKTYQMLIGLPQHSNASICPEVVLDGSSGPCMVFQFTLAAPTTLNFTTLWAAGDTPPAGNPDIDIYACSDSTLANFGTACFEDGGAGATFVDPQSTGNHTYPAGTHYFVVEYFAACDNLPSKCTASGATANYFVTISQP